MTGGIGRRRLLSATGAAGLLLAAPPARAQKVLDTLRVTWREAIGNLDPYYNQLRTGLVLANEAWDTLLARDPQTFQLKPLLATAWRQPDPATIEFTLRPNVVFHDGSPFSSDDVVYTVGVATGDPTIAVPSNYDFLAGAERIDDLHVRIRLKRAFPVALDFLAMTLPILPKAYREKVGPAGYARAPVGTGPWRIETVDGSNHIALARNDDYYAGGAKAKPAIARLLIDEVTDSQQEVDAILEGRADWIWHYDPQRDVEITADPKLQILRAETMRVSFLALDAAGRSGADNPITRLPVRQAILHAIDRATILRRFVPVGGGRLIETPCYPTQFGCDATAATRHAFDPDQSRKLLAEAGFPDGFKTTLVNALLPDWGRAIADNLAAVGIDATVENLSAADAAAKVRAGEAPLSLGSWGSASINDAAAILPVFFGGGALDYARDPQVEALLYHAGTATDPDDRREDYANAIRRITDQADWLPLFTTVTSYAVTRQLNFRPFPDALPRFYLATWK